MKPNFLKTFSAFIFIGISTLVQAQLVNLGSPIKGRESGYYAYFAATHSGNDLWVVCQTYDTTDSKFHLKISKNNGLFWADQYNYSGDMGSAYLLSACFLGGDLYFNASFNNLTLNSVTYPRMNAIFKWDLSTSKLSFIDSVSGIIYDMDTFRNKLVISGAFSRVGANSISSLAEYDGSSWSALGTPADWVNFKPSGSFKNNSQLVVQRNKLYIPGGYNTVNGSKPLYYGIAVYDGTNVNPVNPSEFYDASFLEGEIYAHPDSSRYYTNDSAYKTYYCENGKSKIIVNKNPGAYIQYSETREKFAWRGASVYTLKAGTPGPYYDAPAFIEKLTGKNIKRIYVPDYLRLDASRFQGIFGKGKVFLTLGNMGNMQFFRLDSQENLSATISGKAFVDLNANCVYDYWEKVLKNTWLTIPQVNRTVMTNEDGDYLFTGLGNGPHDIRLSKPANMLYACPSNGKYTDTLTVDSNVVRNFAVKIDTAYHDLSVEIISNRHNMARRGFDEQYMVTVTNNSPAKRSGTVKVTVDNNFNNIVSGSSDLVFSGNKGTLTFTDLDLDESLTVSFTMRTSTSLAINSWLGLYAELDSASGQWDSLPANDKDSCKVRIVASCDPNDKISTPSGDVPKGTTKIQYHINFQNVGNDTAFKVVVVDTIDIHLRLEKIVIGTVSHPYKLRVKDNILIFEFNNIKLVDSATNEPKSKGFVRFSAVMDPNLPFGSTVHNMANIYFDYNEAIETNMTTVRIHDPTKDITDIIDNGKGLNIYPNPGSETINIVNTNIEAGFSLYNINGVVIYQGVLKEGINEIDISSLPSGMYALLTADGKGMAKFIIQH